MGLPVLRGRGAFPVLALNTSVPWDWGVSERWSGPRAQQPAGVPGSQRSSLHSVSSGGQRPRPGPASGSAPRCGRTFGSEEAAVWMEASPSVPNPHPPSSALLEREVAPAGWSEVSARRRRRSAGAVRPSPCVVLTTGNGAGSAGPHGDVRSFQSWAEFSREATSDKHTLQSSRGPSQKTGYPVCVHLG